MGNGPGGALFDLASVHPEHDLVHLLLAEQANADGYFDGSDEELMRLRRDLPLNGETAFADTAAAFAALDPQGAIRAWGELSDSTTQKDGDEDLADIDQCAWSLRMR